MDDEQEMYLDFVIPFGEHAGKQLRDVPLDYLKWLMDKGIPKSGTLKDALEFFEEEIDRATDYYDPPTLGEVVI